ncbi:hypothetical protein [Streptomyces canus]|uniref:hypothetical protein n=1 Tax=Streptomyces canus TaxID=58343 RepID=UPI000748412D|nr:hypothetical protein [Streptomyces canus]KUN14592.1 hypothetical protein AQI96_03855 [Streptomyces canus]
MAPEQRGRTAPWAKALGAVLLTVLAVIVTYYAIGTYKESQRKEAAFGNTREDARRFVDKVLTREGGFPTTRQQMEDVYAATIGRTHAWLYVVRFDGTRTRVVAQFSRSYDRFLHLFGPADTRVSRCFTIDFPSTAADPNQVRITAHDSDESCANVSA